MFGLRMALRSGWPACFWLTADESPRALFRSCMGRQRWGTAISFTGHELYMSTGEETEAQTEV